MPDALITYREAGRQLGVSYEVISGIARCHGLKPKPFPSNGKAKGLNESDMSVIRRALGRPARAKATQTA